MSDEDLDFENPLDKISFGFHTENGTTHKPKQAVVPAKIQKVDKKIKSPIPALNKIDNHIKPTLIPNQKTIAQASSSVSGQPLRPILPKQQIIPIPQNMNLPQTMNNGAPQQYLIVRPLTPGNPNQTKTLAIPMGGQFRFGGKSEFTQGVTSHALTTPTNAESKPASVVNNQVKMVSLPKIPAQITITNSTTTVEKTPPPLVSTTISNTIPVAGSNTFNGGQTNVNASPCPSPGSATSSKSPCKCICILEQYFKSNKIFLSAVHQLLTNVIQLETNICNLQQARLQLERERFEMERDYGKEMLNIFREIKDKLCDMIPVPTAAPSAATTSTTNVIISSTEVEHKNE